MHGFRMRINKLLGIVHEDVEEEVSTQEVSQGMAQGQALSTITMPQVDNVTIKRIM